ncbi:MAG: hypothetical protein WAU24_04815 [Chitinophagaceae bacterium]
MKYIGIYALLTITNLKVKNENNIKEARINLTIAKIKVPPFSSYIIMTRYIIFIITLFAGCKNAQQNETASKKTEVVLDTLNYQDSGYHSAYRIISQKNMDIFNFLEALKWPENSNSSSYDINKTPKWGIRLLTNNISDKGVLFIDPNDNFNKTIGKKQIEEALRARIGKSYEMLSHLTYIYTISFGQYSALKFKENENEEITVNVGSFYELTFETKQKRYYLIKCEYLQLEGE